MGRPQTLATRAKLSAYFKGRKRPDISERMRGQRLSDATRAKLREANLGKRMPEAIKAKIGAANKGRKLSIPDRVNRSLRALLDGRGAKLKAFLAANPEVEAARRAKASAAMKRLNAARKEREAAAKADKLAYLTAIASVPPHIRALWSCTGERA